MTLQRHFLTAISKDFEMGEKKIGIGQLELIAEDMVTPELKAKLIGRNGQG